MDIICARMGKKSATIFSFGACLLTDFGLWFMAFWVCHCWHSDGLAVGLERHSEEQEILRLIS